MLTTFEDLERIFNYTNEIVDRARAATEAKDYLEEDCVAIEETIQKLVEVERLIRHGHWFTMEFDIREYTALGNKLYEQVQSAVTNKAKELSISCRPQTLEQLGLSTTKTNFVPFAQGS